MRVSIILLIISFFILFFTNSTQSNIINEISNNIIIRQMKRGNTRTKESGFIGKILDGCDCGLSVLSFGIFEQPHESSQNPDNNFLKIPRYAYEIESRILTHLTFDRLDLSVKPRLNLKWSKSTEEGKEKWNDDWFINEWLMRIRLTDNAFVSYGRENLQWGPSYLFSPSNPFFKDNGRNNPKREIPGMEFMRFIWLPHTSWTLSFIANLGEGRYEYRTFDFNKTYTIKFDYIGQKAYGSMIISHQEMSATTFGCYGGLTASDALLLYGEGSLSNQTNALYPRKDVNSPFNLSMDVPEDSSIQGVMLAGASYTLNIGPTLTLEAIINGRGYDNYEAEQYYDLRDKAAESYVVTGPLYDLARLTLSQTLDPGLRFLRRHYIMFQYSHNNIKDMLNLICRYTMNVDDNSGQLLFIGECFVGDHTQLFSIGSLNVGPPKTEFNTVIEYQMIVGLEYRF